MNPLPGRRQVPSFLLSLGLLFGAVIGGGSMLVEMPGKSYQGGLPELSARQRLLAQRLRTQVTLLAQTIGERNTVKYRGLQQAAAAIETQLRDLGYPVRTQSYDADGKVVSNIEATLKGTALPFEIVLVGAHYDSVPGSPGANDNASGVAALLELARQLKDAQLPRSIRFVAFVNEEPPFFMTRLMGSRVYASAARKAGDNVVAMLSLETIGYYSEEKNSQQYPRPFNLVYPDTGNFLAFVGDIASRPLVRKSIALFRESSRFPSEGLAAPGSVPGVGWSDHWSFWQEGYQGAMLTDTAPFRYPNYHEATDTPDRIDYRRMALVVEGVGRVLVGLAGKGPR